MFSVRISRKKMGIYFLLVLVLPFYCYLYIYIYCYDLILIMFTFLGAARENHIMQCFWSHGWLLLLTQPFKILQKSQAGVLSLFIWSFLGLKNTWMKLQPFRSWDEKQSIPPSGSPRRNLGQDRSCVSFHVTQKGQTCKQ